VDRPPGPSPERTAPTAPLLYEVATRHWLDRLSRREGRRVTLADVPEAELDRIAAAGFDYLWPMGAWRTGAEAARIAREQPWLRERWAAAFPANGEPEIVASPYAVAEYRVDGVFGGDAGLERLRERLARAGVGLILDVVAHHTATDAPWVAEHPEWYVAGDAELRARDPDGFFRDPVPGTGRWIAHCRDPYFPPWTDAAPLDYRLPAVHEAMTGVLRSVAERCDGVRADMAMLTLADVFRATWDGRSLPPPDGDATAEFWSAAIGTIRAARPGFVFIAEAYWDLEWRLQQLGFDFTYDKTFRDRLVAGDGRALAAHLRAEDPYQRRSVRFLENHDEERAAAVLPPDRNRAGAVLAATVPGMFLVHDGQLEGARFRAPVQFAHRPEEPVDEAIRAFYERLLGVLADTRLRRGSPRRIDPEPAGPGDASHEAFVAHLWTGSGGTAPQATLLAIVNLADAPGRCRLRLPLPGESGDRVELADLLGPAGEERAERSTGELRKQGLDLELPGNGYRLFRLGPP